MRRRLMLNNSGKINYEYVDLGLPSGILWATTNIGAETESDSGLYFAWGDVSGYTKEQIGSSAGQKYFGWADYKYSLNGGSTATAMTKYNSTDGKTVLEPSDDAAAVHMGGSWRMPTTTEFKELYNNTNNSWATINGVNGRKFTSKTDSTKYVFFPAAGNGDNGILYDEGSNGFVWSSSLYSSNVVYGYFLYFLSSSVDPQLNYNRRYGVSVRGVKFNQNNELVDLGLPSGTLWAKCNIGASTETEYGNYYQWGKGASPYQITSGQSIYSGAMNTLSAELDAATQVLGTPYHMPTQTQMQELIDNTTYRWTTNFNSSGVNGAKFTATNGNYIFIPAAGEFYNGSLSNNGSGTEIWSSTPSLTQDAYYMRCYSSEAYIGYPNRKYGLSIRPVVG